MFRILFACLLAFMPLNAYENKGIRVAPTPPIPEGSIGMKLDRNEGYLEMMVMDASGNQEPLTLGTFISYSVNAILGKSVDYCTVDQTQPIYVGYEIKNGGIHSFITNQKGEKNPFTLSSFIGNLSDTLLDCKPYDKAAQPAHTAPVLFEKKGGKLQTMIMNPDGNFVKLNLGNLLSISSQVFPDCTPSRNQDRIVQIVFDESKIYQIDAYGKKEPFTFDNLATAVVETLENCAQDVSSTIAPAQLQSLKIKFVPSTSGSQTTYIVTKGDSVELNLGTLLAASAEMNPNFQGNTNHLLVTYTREPSGEVKGTLTDLMGNQMTLDLPNLVRAASFFYGY